MMIKLRTAAILLSFIALQFISKTTIAQDKVILSGTIRDKQSGESIIKGTIRIQELPNLGVFSNEYGFYSISLSKGKYTIVVSRLGY